MEQTKAFDDSCRLLEFRFKFGDCADLLLPFVYMFDHLFGPCLFSIGWVLTCRKASDDLFHPQTVFLNYMKSRKSKGLLYSRAMAIGTPQADMDKWICDEVVSSPFLLALFRSFSFYYQCSLNYTMEKVMCKLPRSR